VQLVIADTGPVNYLILIGYIDLLPRLFQKIILPDTVQAELADSDAPHEVRIWIDGSPDWIEVREAPVAVEPLADIDDGEQGVILLALALHADLLLMDDRKGVRLAREQGFRVTGTLGILAMASRRGMIDLAEAFARLRRTTFRCSEKVMAELLAREKKG
jgi:predicted nucleic acid-binding protein